MQESSAELSKKNSKMSDTIVFVVGIVILLGWMCHKGKIEFNKSNDEKIEKQVYKTKQYKMKIFSQKVLIIIKNNK